MSIRLSKTIGDIRAGLFARIEQVQDEYAATVSYTHLAALDHLKSRRIGGGRR